MTFADRVSLAFISCGHEQVSRREAKVGPGFQSVKWDSLLPFSAAGVVLGRDRVTGFILGNGDFFVWMDKARR